MLDRKCWVWAELAARQQLPDGVMMNRENFENFHSLFASPHDGSQLIPNSDQKSLIDASGVVYPFFGQVPFLVPEPSLNLHEWTSRFSALLGSLKRDLDLTQEGLKQVDSQSAKGRRLQNSYEANLINLNSLVDLFQDIGLQQQNVSVHEAFSLKISARQNLLSYGDNIFRDWVWGDAEIEKDLQIADTLLSDRRYAQVLTLGAGAGRFSVEWHHRFKPTLSVISDINPPFLLLLNRILSGASLKLAEKPFAPLDSNCGSVIHEIKSKRGYDKNLLLTFADSRRPCFKAESFDLIICPWILDIQPEAANVFLSRINSLLKPGGRTFVFGSLAFHFSNPALNLGRDELREEAETAGLSLVKADEGFGPYLKSPYAAGYRMEQMQYFVFEKTRDISLNLQASVDRPNWIDDLDAPVPDLPAFRNFSLQHKILSDASSQVNGKLGVRSLGRYFARHYKMTEEEGIRVVRNLLLKIYEESTYR